eukprot:CAMPEP_0117474512 /NCGR_PEP_ID=MMETSP0784-20121206/9321_1 /TAXON_ID=39447 /ORGANISM="" /LENGTH=1017 /DNA_ID=CAMNT_0005268737 /DNA_START=90 /DNA_END=3141 /DNA_ORIENTATION=-
MARAGGAAARGAACLTRTDGPLSLAASEAWHLPRRWAATGTSMIASPSTAIDSYEVAAVPDMPKATAALGQRRGPRLRRRKTSIHAIESWTTKQEHRQIGKDIKLRAEAFAVDTSMSLRFHLYGVEDRRATSAAERRRVRSAFWPCGKRPQEIMRLRPTELLELAEGKAQRHRGHVLLWKSLERAAVHWLDALSTGETGRLVRAFGMARLDPTPRRFLRGAAEKLILEAPGCSLQDLATVVHGFGLCRVRDSRLLTACSASWAGLFDDAAAEPPADVGPMVVQLCQGLATLRWADAGALRFASTFVASSLSARSPKHRTGLRPLPGPRDTSAPNLFAMPKVEVDDEESDGTLTERCVADISAAFAELEVRADNLCAAIIADIATTPVTGAWGVGPRAMDQKVREWRCPMLLGRTASSLARLGVTDAAVTARWLRATRARSRQCPTWRVEDVVEAASTARLLGVFQRDISLMLSRMLLRALRLDPTSPRADAAVPCLPAEATSWPGPLVNSQQTPPSVDLGAIGVVSDATPPLGSVRAPVPQDAVALVLQCAMSLSYVPARDLIRLLRAASLSVGAVQDCLPVTTSPSRAKALAQLVTLRCMTPLRPGSWPFTACDLLRGLDESCRSSLGLAELLGVYRGAAALILQGEVHVDAFSALCPKLSRNLTRRLEGLLEEFQAMDAQDFTDRRLASLTRFALYGEALRSRQPGAVFGEDAGLLVSAGRFIRSMMTRIEFSPPTLETGVTLLEWLTFVPTPPSSEAVRRLRHFLAQRVKLLTGSLLWRAACWSPPPLMRRGGSEPSCGARSGGLPLLAALLGELPAKLRVLQAEHRLRIVVRLLLAARRNSRASERRQGGAQRASRWSFVRVQSPRLFLLQRLARRHALALLVDFDDKPLLLSQASDAAIESAAAVACVPGFRRSLSHHINGVPEVLLPCASPWGSRQSDFELYVAHTRQDLAADDVPSPRVLVAGESHLATRMRGPCLLGRCACGAVGVCRRVRNALRLQLGFRGLPGTPEP